MGLITVHSQEAYERAIKSLFPEGDWWDAQFADPDSDLSRWCSAKSAELTRIKVRRAALLSEGFPGSADETIGDWERIFDLDNSDLPLEQRRSSLLAMYRGSINKAQLESLCAIFGATLDDLVFPHAPAFFGRTRFKSRMATPAALSTVWLYITTSDFAGNPILERHLTKALLANHIISFFYKGADGEYTLS